MAKLNYSDLSNLRPLDPDKLAKDLKLEKRAKDAANNGSPPADANDFDDNERAIISRLESHRASVRADLPKKMQALDADLAAYQSKVLTDLNISDARNRLTALRHDREEGQRQLARDRRNYEGAQAEFQNYRDRRGIIDYPPKKQHWITHFGILFLLIIAEGAANLYFFKEGNSLGLLGGFVTGFGVSLLNVFLSYAFTVLCVRYVRSKLIFPKLGGILSLGILALGILTFHSLIAFYRQASHEAADQGIALSPLELTQQAWTNLLGLQFYLIDIVSIGLFVMGVAFAIWAAVKAFNRGHPYPGYDRKYKTFRKFEITLMDTEKDFRDNYINEVFEISDDLKARLENQAAVRSSIEKLSRQKADHLRRVDEIDEELAEIANDLIGRYRAANRKARRTPAPDYFDSLYVKETHFGKGSAGQNYDKNIITAKQAGNASAEHSAAELIKVMDAEGEELQDMLRFDGHVAV